MPAESVTVDGVKYVRVLDQEDVDNNPTWPWIIGEQYMIRTVTFYDHGTLIGVTEHEIVLKKAAWIADTGRWYDFIFKKKDANEVEPFSPDEIVIIGRGAIVDAVRRPGSFEVQK